MTSSSLQSQYIINLVFLINHDILITAVTMYHKPLFLIYHDILINAVTMYHKPNFPQQSPHPHNCNQSTNQMYCVNQHLTSGCNCLPVRDIKEVTWCFMPSQPAWLYQGKQNRTKKTKHKREEKEKDHSFLRPDLLSFACR